MADNPRDSLPAQPGSGERAGVLSNVANILGVSGAAEGRESAVDIEELKRRGVEPDRHPFIYYWAFLAATAVFVVAAVIGVTQFVELAGIREVHAKELAVVDPRLAEVRAYDHKLTENYDVVDAEKGLYRIPVSEAARFIVDQPSLILNVRSGGNATEPPASTGPSTPPSTPTE